MRDEYEAKFIDAVVKFEKEYLGCVHQDVKTIFLGDMIAVRLIGSLTPAEMKLTESCEGKELVKESPLQHIQESTSLN
jgi:uncharacterized protein YbcI